MFLESSIVGALPPWKTLETKRANLKSRLAETMMVKWWKRDGGREKTEELAPLWKLCCCWEK